MKTMFTLKVNDSEDGVLKFGMPENDREMKEMFDFRYRVYCERGYVSPSQSKSDVDEYDRNGCCQYFIAKMGDQIIGTMRQIQNKALPIFNYFSFPDPGKESGAPPANSCEIGRLIVSHKGAGCTGVLPRGLVSLFLMKCAAEYAKQNGIGLSYAFIKAKLERKMRNRKMPLKYIRNYEQSCSPDDLLFDYFSNPKDPVHPVYFLTHEFDRYLKRIINRVFFEIKNGIEYRIRQNLMTKVLFGR